MRTRYPNPSSGGFYTAYISVTSGTLVIEDSGENGTITGSHTRFGIIDVAGGSLELKGGNLINTRNPSSAAQYSYGVSFSSGSGSVKVSGGSISGNTCGINFSTTGTGSVEVSGGSVRGGTYAIYRDWDSASQQITITGGSLSSGEGYDLIYCNNSNCTVSVSNCDLSTSSSPLFSGFLSCPLVLTNVKLGSASFSHNGPVTATGVTAGTGQFSVYSAANITDCDFSQVSYIYLSSGSVINSGTFNPTHTGNLAQYLADNCKFYVTDVARVSADTPEDFTVIADLNGSSFFDDAQFIPADLSRNDVVTLYQSTDKNFTAPATSLGSKVTIVTKPGVAYTGEVTANSFTRGLQVESSESDGVVTTVYTVVVLKNAAKLYAGGTGKDVSVLEGVEYERPNDALSHSTGVEDLLSLELDNVDLYTAMYNGKGYSSTYDLNGKTVVGGPSEARILFQVPNRNYAVNVVDRVGSASVSTEASTYLINRNGFGTLSIYGGTYKNEPDGGALDCISLGSQGTLNFYGGTYVGNHSVSGGVMNIDFARGTALGNASNGRPEFVGDFNITGGSVNIRDGYFAGGFSKTGGTLEVKGGFFTAASKASLEAAGITDLNWDEGTTVKVIDGTSYEFYHIYDPTYIDNDYDMVEATSGTTYDTVDTNYTLANPGDWIILSNPENDGKVITVADGYRVAAVQLVQMGERSFTKDGSVLYAAVPMSSVALLYDSNSRYLGAYDSLTNGMVASQASTDTLVLLNNLGSTWFYPHTVGHPEIKSLTLDLNGCSWVGESGTMDGLIHNYSPDIELKVINSSDEDSVVENQGEAFTVCEYNYGTTSIFNGDYRASGKGGYVLSTIGSSWVQDPTAVLNVYGGTFTASGEASGIMQLFRSTVNIYGGTFDATQSAEGSVMVFGVKDTVNIHGGLFKGKVSGLENNLEPDTVKVYIDGGIFDKDAKEGFESEAILPAGSGFNRLSAADLAEHGLTGEYYQVGEAHNWVISPGDDKDSITVKCTVDGCTFTTDKEYTATLVADPAAYTGNPFVATVATSEGFPDIVPIGEIEYWQGDTQLDSAPVGVGTYVAKVVIGEDETAQTLEKEFSITALAMEGVTAQGYSDVFDGQAHTITVSGYPEGSTVVYNTTGPDDEYDLTAPPEFSSVGTHTVYYKVSCEGYDDFTGSATVVVESASIPVTPVTPTIAATAADVAVERDGLPHGIEVKVTSPAEGSTVRYGTVEGTYDLDESPALIEVGELAVYWMVTADGYQSVSGSAKVTVVPGKLDDTVGATVEAVYDGQPHGIVVTVPEGAEVKYGATEGTYDLDETPTFTDAGEYTVYWRATLGAAEKEGSTKVVISKAVWDGEIVAPDVKVAYDQQPHAIAVTGTPAGSTVRYGTEEGAYDSTSAPEFTASGAYQVFWQVTSRNYENITGSTSMVIEAPMRVDEETGVTAETDAFVDAADAGVEVVLEVENTTDNGEKSDEAAETQQEFVGNDDYDADSVAVYSVDLNVVDRETREVKGKLTEPSEVGRLVLTFTLARDPAGIARYEGKRADIVQMHTTGGVTARVGVYVAIVRGGKVQIQVDRLSEFVIAVNEKKDDSKLVEALAQADAELAATLESEDGATVGNDEKWATSADRAKLAEVVAEYRAIVDAMAKGAYEGTQGDIEDAENAVSEALAAFKATEKAGSLIALFRMYDGNRGEHFYTTAADERDSLVEIGWSYEGVGWYAPAAGAEIYRLYNENEGGMHFYTTDASERDALVDVGWRWEEMEQKLYSADDSMLYVFREYNPNSTNGEHNYTTSEVEHNALVDITWKPESSGIYASKEGRPA